MKFIRIIILLLFVCLVEQNIIAQDIMIKDTASDNDNTGIKWHEIRYVIGRFSAEFERLNFILNEVDRLKNAAEDLRIIQLYPVSLTGLKDEKAVFLDKQIKECEKRVQNIEKEIDKIEKPLIDAIGILKELVYEETRPDVLELLLSESKSRVTKIIRLKRKIIGVWSDFNKVLDYLYELKNLPLFAKKGGKGFSHDFFQVIYSNLGMSSDMFFNKLSAYKNNIVSDATTSVMKKIANMDLKLAIERYNRGEYDVVEENLINLAMRFDKKITLNGIYYYLGKVLQILGKREKAINSYSQISTSSRYYQSGIAGLLKALYDQRKYRRVIAVYKQAINEIKENSELKNQILFIISQAYYELGQDYKIVEISSKADKNKKFYAGILYVLGQSYIRKEDFETAKTVFKNISDLRNKSERYKQKFINMSDMALSHIYFSEGLYKKALSSYVKLLDQEEFFQEALEGIAWCYIKLEKFNKAEIVLKKLVNQFPTEPAGAEALLTLSKTYLRKGVWLWEMKKENIKGRKRIDELFDIIKERFQNNEIDSVKYNGLVEKLNNVLKKSEKNKVKNKIIDDNFDKSYEFASLLIKNYQTGEFIQNEFNGNKKEIILNLKDLELKTKTVKKI